ncbi:acyl-CoA carboxylase epsilon subunit, partial [Kitasatospora sp. NPDC004272]
MNEPLVRVVRGSLTAEELAALTAVLAARAADDADERFVHGSRSPPSLILKGFGERDR